MAGYHACLQRFYFLIFGMSSNHCKFGKVLKNSILSNIGCLAKFKFWLIKNYCRLYIDCMSTGSQIKELNNSGTKIGGISVT